MKFKKRIQWATTFSALALFTVHTVASLYGGTTSAYASVIRSDRSFGNHEGFVVADLESGGHLLSRVIGRLTRERDQARELCGLTREQMTILSLNIDVRLKDVMIGNRTIPVLEPRRVVTKREVEAAVGGIECRKFEVYEQILLLLGVHLS